MEEKLTAAQQEATRVTDSLNALRKTFDAERTAWLKDKSELEGTIVELSTSGQSSVSDRAAREDEVRVQLERIKVFLP